MVLILCVGSYTGLWRERKKQQLYSVRIYRPNASGTSPLLRPQLLLILTGDNDKKKKGFIFEMSSLVDDREFIFPSKDQGKQMA